MQLLRFRAKIRFGCEVGLYRVWNMERWEVSVRESC